MGEILNIVDIGTGEEIEKLEFPGVYNIQCTSTEDSGRIFNSTRLDKYIHQVSNKNDDSIGLREYCKY